MARLGSARLVVLLPLVCWSCIVYEPQAIYEFRSYTCPTGTCDKTYVLDNADLNTLVECYGWDGTAWGPDAPDELVGCDPASSSCTITVLEDYVQQMTATCADCIDATLSYPDVTPIWDCCAWPTTTIPELSWQNAGLEFWQALTGDCDVYPVEVPDCSLEETETPSWGTICEEQECKATSAPGADYRLEIDQAFSYLELTTSSDTDQVAVCGGGGAASGPARFMTALMWAGDGELSGVDYTDWRFFFDTPIDIDLQNGQFVVPSAEAPYLNGSGYTDGTAYGMKLDMGEDATGTMNSSTGEWSLDYTETSGSMTVQLHLEGPFWPVE